MTGRAVDDRQVEVLSHLWQLGGLVHRSPHEHDGWRRVLTLLGETVPGAQRSLWIGVDHQYTQPAFDRFCSDADSRARLTYAALLACRHDHHGQRLSVMTS